MLEEPLMMDECVRVLQAILEDNTPGASELARRAVQCVIPFFETWGDPSPFTEELGQKLRIEPKDPGEVLAMPHLGIEVVNRYFDITPITLLSGVITEERVWGEDELHGF